MSQSPYNPPNVPGYYSSGYAYGSFDPIEPLRRPARLSGIAMIVVGVLMLLFGGCVSGFSQFPFEQYLGQMPPDAAQQMALVESTLGITFSTYLLIAGCLAMGAGLVVFVLGIMARGGEMGWVVTALVVMGLLSLMSLIGVLGSVATDPRGACMWLPMAGVCVAISIGLILALRNNGRIREMQRQIQMQMYVQQQYQQQQMQRTGPWGQSFNPPTNPPTPQ